jgi:hypothetical protein
MEASSLSAKVARLTNFVKEKWIGGDKRAQRTHAHFASAAVLMPVRLCAFRGRCVRIQAVCHGRRTKFHQRTKPRWRPDGQLTTQAAHASAPIQQRRKLTSVFLLHSAPGSTGAVTIAAHSWPSPPLLSTFKRKSQSLAVAIWTSKPSSLRQCEAERISSRDDSFRS